jgi:hypothetical protein
VTALDALCVILDAGGKAVPGPERPRLLAPPAMRPLAEAHREGLRALLLAYGPRPSDVFRRAQAFRRQIDEWAASNGPGVPVLVLPESPAPKLGRCISCGCPIADGWRCAVCLEAIHVALGLADTENKEPGR